MKKWLRVSLAVAVLVAVGGLVVLSFREIGESVWDGKSQLVLAVGQAKKIGVWRWVPEKKVWQKLILPEDLLLPIAQGYGSYQVGSLVELDGLEGKGGRLVQVGLQEALGIGIDGYKIEGATNLSWWDGISLRIRGGGEEQMN